MTARCGVALRRFLRRLAACLAGVMLAWFVAGAMMFAPSAAPPARAAHALAAAQSPAAAGAAAATPPALVGPYRPFIDPLPPEAFDVWPIYLLPMSLLIALAYKGVRAPQTDWRPLLLGVLAMAAQITLGMAALAGLSFAIVEVFVPLIRG